MATATKKQQQDNWSEGMSKLNEAVRHNVTATSLAAAGVVALSAAAFAYFWDPARRTGFVDASRKMSEDMMNWWSKAGQPEETPQPQ
jgi:hypothetical protein